jgi:hypothetical protein
VFDLQAGIFAGLGGVLVFVACRGLGVVGNRKGLGVHLAAESARQVGDGVFLLVWTGGVFVFAAKLNWSINARSVLPLVAPVCVLTQRAVERGGRRGMLAYVLAGLGAGGVSVLALVADYQCANANRAAARELTMAHSRQVVWFTGHWGFQYYMQLDGARPLDDRRPECRVGDVVVLPLNNYGSPPKCVGLRAIGSLVVPGFPWMTLLDGPLGADYYFSPGDRLPMVFGSVPPQGFLVFGVTGNLGVGK